MARIRTVKPDFFRHEKLQDLEVNNPGKYIMLVFQGLWTLSDSKGKFIYKPRTIKLDVLPFIPFEINDTLKILIDENFIEVYEVKGEKYGLIPSFNEHQRLSGKELSEGEKHPDPEPDKVRETNGKQEGSDREADGKHLESQEGKGKEGKGGTEFMKDFKITDCKLSVEDLEYQVISGSIRLYKGFVSEFPNNKDLPLMLKIDWIPPVRALMVKKKYTYDQIKQVVEWALKDKFWKTVILDTEKLEKNFEKLKLQYQNG